mgnify:CR=1 FL=1
MYQDIEQIELDIEIMAEFFATYYIPFGDK